MVENTATTPNHLNPQPGAPVGVAEPRSPDLADHFLWCSKLGRYLTVSDGSRFVITDDFRDAPVQPEAAAVASIYSKDLLVAQSALLPLGAPVHKMSPRKREKYERLFTLIEKQALSDVVRHSAREVLNAGFRNAEIRALEAELGGKLNRALDICGQYERKIVMTGRSNGATGQEFGDLRAHMDYAQCETAPREGF